MKQIELTKGKFTIVDDEDFNWLNQWKWHAGKDGKYASRSEWLKGQNKNGKMIYMHRLIMDCSEGMEVDHINHNTLDNRRKNLRVCSYYQNHVHSKKQVTNKSGYKGVSQSKGRKKWEACISINNKTYHLGLYITKEEAARAYDKKAKETWGEFAVLNGV